MHEARPVVAVVVPGEEQAAGLDEEDPGDSAVPGQNGEPGCRPAG